MTLRPDWLAYLRHGSNLDMPINGMDYEMTDVSEATASDVGAVHLPSKGGGR